VTRCRWGSRGLIPRHPGPPTSLPPRPAGAHPPPTGPPSATEWRRGCCAPLPRTCGPAYSTPAVAGTSRHSRSTTAVNCSRCPPVRAVGRLGRRLAFSRMATSGSEPMDCLALALCAAVPAPFSRPRRDPARVALPSREPEGKAEVATYGGRRTRSSVRSLRTRSRRPIVGKTRKWVRGACWLARPGWRELFRRKRGRPRRGTAASPGEQVPHSGRHDAGRSPAPASECRSRRARVIVLLAQRLAVPRYRIWK